MQPLVEDGVRPPGVAGFFYPSSAERLRAVVGDYIGSTASPGTRPRALVAPHAGYDYSGAVAGKAFAAAAGMDWDAVVVVGPSHLESFPGVSLFPGVAYRTPLGLCPLDTGFAENLLQRASTAIRSVLNGHWREGDPRQEHALEVELPFLQSMLSSEPRIVPLVMGEQSWDTVEELGGALADAVSAMPDPERVLMVASSDLSHFHADTTAEALDRATLDAVEAFDPHGLHRALRSGQAEACGGGAIAAVQIAAQRLGASRAKTITYAHSGHVSGDRTAVVGYGAVLIH